MKESSLVRIAIVQFIVLIILVFTVTFLALEINKLQDNINTLEVKNGEFTNKFIIDVEYVSTSCGQGWMRSKINITVVNNEDTIIGPKAISYEAISKDVNGTMLDSDIGFNERSLEPNDSWKDEVSLTVPGHFDYDAFIPSTPGYRIDIYIFHKGDLIYKEGEIFLAENWR